MNSAQGISKKPSDIPTLNFNKLREEGIKLIQELSGEIWTDYNLHDPGITTLEVLCYALTDLGYRIEELMDAYKSNESVEPDFVNSYFFHADELLPHLPLTKRDFEEFIEKNHSKVLSAWCEEYSLLHHSGPVQGGYEIALLFSYDEEFGNLDSDTISIPFEETEALLEIIIFDEENRRMEWKKIQKINSCHWIENDPDCFFVFEKFNCQAALELEVINHHQKTLSTIHTKARVTFNPSKEHREKFGSIEIHQEAIIQKLESPEFLKALVQALSKEHYKAKLLDDIRQSLLPFRNVCEDFIKFRVINEQEIKIEAEIILHEFAPDVNKINNIIYDQLDTFLMQMMLKVKNPMHGTQKNILYASNFIEEMVKVQGVEAATILNLNLFVDGVPTIPLQDEASFECIHLQGFAHYVPKISRLKSNITFFRSGVKENAEEAAITKEFKPQLQVFADRKPDKKAESRRTKANVLSKSFFEDLRRYSSIQNDFPQNYRLREKHLSAKAPEKLKVRVRQFKAYLVFFERILIDYLEQLYSFHDLMSVKPTTEPAKNELETLKSQIPDLELLKLIDEKKWNITTPSPEGKYSQLLRQHRILDHLLARFSTHYMPILTNRFNVNTLEKALQDKKLLLSDIPIITKERGLGLPIKPEVKNIWETDLLSGFQKRIYRILGMNNKKLKHYQLSKLKGDEPVGFYLVEHILLIERKEESITKKKFNKAAELLFNYIMSLPVKDHPKDPYTFQMTIILPNWYAAWHRRRNRVENLLKQELPAHIHPTFYWLNEKSMGEFELLYENWLKSIFEMHRI